MPLLNQIYQSIFPIKFMLAANFFVVVFNLLFIHNIFLTYSIKFFVKNFFLLAAFYFWLVFFFHVFIYQVRAYSRAMLHSTIKCCLLLWNYAKLYFNAKHLEKGWIVRGISGDLFQKSTLFHKECPFGQSQMLP